MIGRVMYGSSKRIESAVILCGQEEIDPARPFSGHDRQTG